MFGLLSQAACGLSTAIGAVGHPQARSGGHDGDHPGRGEQSAGASNQSTARKLPAGTLYFRAQQGIPDWIEPNMRMNKSILGLW